jgi:hypothetical protein
MSSNLSPLIIEAELRPDPFGESGDRVVSFRRVAGHHLEGVEHFGKDIEPHLDAGLPGLLGEHAAVVDQSLVSARLQVNSP